ncbi:hypothetical protein BJ508DRAFT_375718 [Ascobolus immersus RN42]|uniref:Uncharacterized protein n=1 Tax=Ascobolus immersus RN42 TaxID=1160509 RepID=A0A3N4ILG5_ASCIM|nr:hypothetical protein BJ508DRAFT_375718 [Ascobolus immersus RN42]
MIDIRGSSLAMSGASELTDFEEARRFNLQRLLKDETATRVRRDIDYSNPEETTPSKGKLVEKRTQACKEETGISTAAAGNPTTTAKHDKRKQESNPSGKGSDNPDDTHRSHKSEPIPGIQSSTVLSEPYYTTKVTELPGRQSLESSGTRADPVLGANESGTSSNGTGTPEKSSVDAVDINWKLLEGENRQTDTRHNFRGLEPATQYSSQIELQGVDPTTTFHNSLLASINPWNASPGPSTPPRESSQFENNPAIEGAYTTGKPVPFIQRRLISTQRALEKLSPLPVAWWPFSRTSTGNNQYLVNTHAAPLASTAPARIWSNQRYDSSALPSESAIAADDGSATRPNQKVLPARARLAAIFRILLFGDMGLPEERDPGQTKESVPSTEGGGIEASRTFHLLLCVDSNSLGITFRYKKTCVIRSIPLSYSEVMGITDRELFKKIADHYLDSLSWYRRLLNMHTVANIKLAKFSLLSDTDVEVTESIAPEGAILDIPERSTTEPWHRTYFYEPVPGNHATGQRMLDLFFMGKPGGNARRCVSTIPILIGDPLLFDETIPEFIEGYGLHLVDGINFVKVLRISILLLLATVATAAGISVATGDIGKGCGLAALIFAVVPVFITLATMVRGRQGNGGK